MRVTKTASVTIDDGVYGFRIRDRDITGTIIGPSALEPSKVVVEWDDLGYDHPRFTVERPEELKT